MHANYRNADFKFSNNKSSLSDNVYTISWYLNRVSFGDSGPDSSETRNLFSKIIEFLRTSGSESQQNTRLDEILSILGARPGSDTKGIADIYQLDCLDEKVEPGKRNEPTQPIENDNEDGSENTDVSGDEELQLTTGQTPDQTPEKTSEQADVETVGSPEPESSTAESSPSAANNDSYNIPVPETIRANIDAHRASSTVHHQQTL